MNKLKEFTKNYSEIRTFHLESDFEKKYHKNQIGRFYKLFKEITKFIKKDEKGLDVGIYPGFLTYCLKRSGYDLSAIDLTPEKVNKNIAKNIKIMKADIEKENLPFSDGEFDYVLFTAVIEHLRINPIKTISEIRRILKPGGLFIVQTPNLGRLAARIKFLFGRGLLETPYSAFSKIYEYGYLGHLRLFLMPELVEILEKNGFRVIYKKHMHNFNGRPKNWFQFYQYILGIIPSLKWQLFVVGKKK